jgi:hypothetical protein
MAFQPFLLDSRGRKILALSCTFMPAKSKPYALNMMDKLMIKRPNPRHFALKTALICLFAGLIMSTPARAQGNISSVYTDIDLNACMVLTADDFGASYACPGFRGFPLHIAEGDLRFFVSYGFGAPDEMAAGQTVPAFNTIGNKLEWRISNITGDFVPFASILRYYTQVGDGSAPDGQILVVTKIETGNTCHIAYIDARLTPKANEIARQLADETATDFDCTTDQPKYIPSAS